MADAIFGRAVDTFSVHRRLRKLFLCRRGDLNPYALFGHQALNLARLPIPPLRLVAPLYLPGPTPTLVASKVPNPVMTRPVTLGAVTV